MEDPATLAAGPDMDRLIAQKVMGWETRISDSREVPHYRFYIIVTGSENDHEDSQRPGTTFAPSTNIAHAWEVVERLPISHRDASAHFSVQRESDGRWSAGYIDSDPAFTFVKGEAETAPLAICRAALKAMEP